MSLNQINDYCRRAVAPDLQRFEFIALLATVIEVILFGIIGIIFRSYYWLIFVFDGALKLYLGQLAGEGARTYYFATLRKGAVCTGLLTFIHSLLSTFWCASLVITFSSASEVHFTLLLLLGFPVVLMVLNVTFYALLLHLFVKHAVLSCKRSAAGAGSEAYEVVDANQDSSAGSELRVDVGFFERSGFVQTDRTTAEKVDKQ